MKKIIFALLLLPLLSVAQNVEQAKGMKFEHGLSWTDIQAKAKAENKFIFMDCFTTWCGPCKYMTQNIFPLGEVGGFYNEKYINVKVQLDTTATDNAEVKKWYQDGHDIAAKYNVRAYPTYLFFDPNGSVVHRSVGSSDAKTFVDKGNDALNPEKQYYTQLRKYENGQKDPDLLKGLALIALNAYDLQNASKISNEYLASQTNLFTKDNLEFIDKFTMKSSDKGFALFLHNTEKVNALMGKGKAEKKITGIITSEDIYPVILKRNATAAPDFGALSASLTKKYPKYAAELTASAKVIYYQYKGEWNHFQSEVISYMKKYGAKAEPAELNNFAWTVFENCKDMSCVTEALEWSKRSFKDKEDPMFMDTYANILHKLGKTKEAIEWESKALALAQEGDKKTYQDTLDKMKKGEKTWTEK